MKKIKVILMFFVAILLCSNGLSLAEDSRPLIGTEWEGISYETILLNSYEKAFLELHKVTEEDVKSEKAFIAFGLMKEIYKLHELDVGYKENAIKNLELKQLLKDLSETINNPKTDKDYFYKGLLAYKEPRDKTADISVNLPPEIREKLPKKNYGGVSNVSELFDSFKYIIDKFPDSIYAEYSYIFLADNYKGNIPHGEEESINVLNKYLGKYGENGKLTPYVYFRFATMYQTIYLKGIDYQSQKDKKNLDFMFEYLNKLVNKFPEKKEIMGETLIELGHYYSYHKNHDKALEYYHKVYNDSSYYTGDIYQAMEAIAGIYRFEKKYDKLDNFLEDMRTRYFKYSGFRKNYKELKQVVEEVKRFGYDEYDQSKENKKILKDKKDDILKFRKEYEKRWDKDFNLIKP